MFKITLNGREMRLDQVGEELQRAIAAELGDEIRSSIQAIRRPDTGEFPTVVVHGDSLETLKVQVEGSSELLSLVRERLGDDMEHMTFMPDSAPTPPRVFLSYAWEDGPLAKRLAEALQQNGIDTWWAQWSIGPGDSLRQKIDEGLAGCTHFIVLLTPASIEKPWVNQEMDAALVLKLNSATKFIALRLNLPASKLPPLLSGSLSPTLDDFDADVRQLVNDVHGVSRRPPLGPPPTAAAPQTGCSPAATRVAEAFVRRSRHGTFADPQLTTSEVAHATGLTEEDVRDALHELQHLFSISLDRALPRDELFVAFDKHFMGWDASVDALRIATDLHNDRDFSNEPEQIAARYGWQPRRLNPAIAFLINRKILMDTHALGTQPWSVAFIQARPDDLRRFVKSRP